MFAYLVCRGSPAIICISNLSLMAQKINKGQQVCFPVFCDRPQLLHTLMEVILLLEDFQVPRLAHCAFLRIYSCEVGTHRARNFICVLSIISDLTTALMSKLKPLKIINRHQLLEHKDCIREHSWSIINHESDTSYTIMQFYMSFPEIVCPC